MLSNELNVCKYWVVPLPTAPEPRKAGHADKCNCSGEVSYLLPGEGSTPHRRFPFLQKGMFSEGWLEYQLRERKQLAQASDRLSAQYMLSAGFSIMSETSEQCCPIELSTKVEKFLSVLYKRVTICG